MTKARQEQMERLEAATRKMLTSEGFRRWISTRAKFHAYSIRNQILIAIQCPEATRVAGFRKWQEMKRQVRKGEKGIRILAPIQIKEEDPDTGKETKRLWFKVVSVFDISQTDGEPLPELPRRELAIEDPDEALHIGTGLYRLAEEIGVPVTLVDKDDDPHLASGKVLGYHDPRENQIVVRAGIGALPELRVLTHELAHALGVGYEEFGRDRAEVIVEAATTVALSTLGFDTEGESIPYIAAYAENEDGMQILQGDLGKIDEIATRIEVACGVEQEAK